MRVRKNIGKHVSMDTLATELGALLQTKDPDLSADAIAVGADLTTTDMLVSRAERMAGGGWCEL